MPVSPYEHPRINSDLAGVVQTTQRFIKQGQVQGAATPCLKFTLQSPVQSVQKMQTFNKFFNRQSNQHTAPLQ
jgi:hypothetical protein